MIEEFQRKSIYTSIADAGWKITEVDAPELDWWAAEMWQLESTWSPVGKAAFITFLYEPESLQNVWEVRASHDKPEDRHWNKTSCYMSLKSRWESELPIFIECLSRLRDS